MEFSLIKYHKEEVTLNWRDENDKHTEKRSIEFVCTDEPEPTFAEAFNALLPIVMRLCELPVEYAEGLQVTTVSFQKGGVIITALKQLEAYNGPLPINTPFMKEEGDAMPGDLHQALATLKDEAERYQKGERMQLDMMAGKA